MATNEQRQFAIVTGASSGIGFELARCCGEHGYDLLIASDEPQIEQAAAALRSTNAAVEAVQCDLATAEGVEKLISATQGRPVDALLANAGHGLGGGFLDQDWNRIRHVIDTNVTGTLYLIHELGRDMRKRGAGRILITGSIAGLMPGTFQAVYNGTKALLDSFAIALRAELANTGVSVTCLVPGATETQFFARADMKDTKIGSEKKQSPAAVAKLGFEAMQRGDAEVVTGWQNKLRAAIARVMPSGLLAEQHRKLAQPGTAKS